MLTRLLRSPELTKLIFALIAVSGLLMPSAVLGQTYEQSDAELENSGRYAFLPNVFIDIESGWETNSRRLQGSRIRLCSTEDLNCLDGSTFNVVWPKACDFFDIGERWEVPLRTNGEMIASEVTSTFNRRGRHVVAVYYLVRTDGVDDFLYILRSQRGLVGVVHDPQERGVLSDRVNDETFLAELSTGRTETIEGFAVSYLAGGANVEVCNSRL